MSAGYWCWFQHKMALIWVLWVADKSASSQAGLLSMKSSRVITHLLCHVDSDRSILLSFTILQYRNRYNAWSESRKFHSLSWFVWGFCGSAFMYKMEITLEILFYPSRWWKTFCWQALFSFHRVHYWSGVQFGLQAEKSLLVVRDGDNPGTSPLSCHLSIWHCGQRLLNSTFTLHLAIAS